MFSKLKDLFSEPDERNQMDAEHLARLAATALLIELSDADHSIDTAETQAILQIAKDTFALDDSELDQFFSAAELKKQAATSLYEFTDTINASFDKNQKFELVCHLWQVAYADQHLDRYEEHTIRKIAELLYVSHSEFMRAKHRIAPNAAGSA